MKRKEGGAEVFGTRLQVCHVCAYSPTLTDESFWTLRFARMNAALKPLFYELLA